MANGDSAQNKKDAIKAQQQILRDIKREKDDRLKINQLQQAYLQMKLKELQAEKEIAILRGNTTELAALEKEVKWREKKIVQLDQEKGILISQNEMRETSNQLIDGMASRLGIASSATRHLFKDLNKNFQSLKASAEAAGEVTPAINAAGRMVEQFGKSLWDAYHPMNLIESAFDAIWTASGEFFFRSSRAIAQFNAAAGDLGTASRDVGRAINLSLGVNIEEAASAAAGLAGSFTEFTSISGRTRSDLITTTAALERMGIGAQESGAQMTYFVQAAGMSIPQAEKQMKQLSVAAAEFGKTPAQFASEFASASASLASHGPKMLEVFLDLESVAKASGIAMDKLLGIAEKFDTFDAAASSVGNLNALMGGDYLNTLEMMNMTEKERISALKEALFLQGRSFDQMERFERKAIAESIGTDEQTLAQMMGYSTRESRKARREADAKMRQDKRMNKMAAQTVDIMEALQFMFQGLFAQTGLMDAFGDAFGKLFKMLGPDSPVGDSIREITGLFGNLMGDVLTMGVNTIIEVIGTGEEMKETFKGWTKSIKAWFTTTKDQDGGSSIIKTWKKKLTAGLAELTGFFGGETFAPVRVAIAKLITDPMSNAFESFKHKMRTKGTGSEIIDFLGGQDAMIGIIDNAQEAMGEYSGVMQADLVEPTKKAVSDVETILGSTGGSESDKFRVIGKSINSGYHSGMDPKAMNKVTKQLVDSTNQWAEALKKVADAAKEVGENMGSAEGTVGAGGATALGGRDQRVVLVVDDEEFSAYIKDTTWNNAMTYANQDKV